MAWIKEAVTPGEIEALKRAASLAWDDDTRYPRWNGSYRNGNGQCYVTSRWLVEQLGGYIGIKQGHYAWVSPDGEYAIDLTGEHSGETYYGSAEGYESIPLIDDERSARFNKRATRLFDHMIKTGEMIGDAFPGEEPQRAEDNAAQAPQFLHDEPGLDDTDSADGQYNFIYADGQLEVSPADMYGHDDLKAHTNLDGDSRGPIAAGHILVQRGNAVWDVHSNVNVRILHRIFKDYTKNVGWKWGGLTNIDGEPIDDDFAPRRSARRINYVFDGHLYLGRTSHAVLALQAKNEPVVGGTITIVGERANVNPVYAEALPSLFEWAEDAGIALYSYNEVKRHEDLQQDNLGDPGAQERQNPVERNGDDDAPIRDESGVYRCPACKQIFPSWQIYQRHRRDDEPWDDSNEIETTDEFPEVNMDATFPTHFTEQQPFTMPVVSYREAARVPGFSKYARVFGYDNDEYRHYVAYTNGSPVGYASIRDNHLQMVHSASQGNGVARALIFKVMAHYPLLYTNTSYDWEEKVLTGYGWYNLGKQRWKWAAGQQPTDMLEAPLPFVYDVDHDRINVGQPGQRTSDIPGKFTPGGVIEGLYEPGGRVVVTTMTNMPYSVRHMIELWYYSHPEYTVRSVVLQDGAGGETKLASLADVGIVLKAMVHAHAITDDATKALTAAGGHVYAVGGAVRDAIMDKDPHDIDLMVTGLPAAQVEATLRTLPGQVKLTGNSFGVFRYANNGEEVEVALPRTETSTGPDHTDFDVNSDHTLPPEADLGRRDFTANAMAVDLDSGQLLDPHNGASDINNNVLRTVSPNSLSEDPLRVLRGIVAHGKHGLEPDEDTRSQLQQNAESVTREPAERVQQELDKIMESKSPASAIRLAHETGVLRHILPQVDSAFGYNQNNPHHELELGEHLLSVLNRVSKRSDDRDLRLAGLFHDIGKPASEWVDPETGRNHFYRGPNGEGNDHEDVGAEMTKEIMGRLRYPNDRTARVSDLVRHHMWPAFTSDRGARKFLNRVGGHADDLMTLRWADQGGKAQYPTSNTLNLDTQQALIDRVRSAGEPTSQAQLAINGNDLIAAGIPQGPEIGRLLNDLTQQVIENPDMNNRDTLLTLVRDRANIPPALS